VLTLTWLAVYALLIGRSSGLLRRPRVRKALDRFTGVVLIAFGVRLALERR
jgi:threonine/homoserine/homoserine lactone efflux protein